MQKEEHKRGKYISLEKRTGLWGLIFLLPWIFGFITFFIKPIIEVIIYSFNKVDLGENGKLIMNYIGIDNYVKALTVDVEYNKMLVTTILQSIPSVALVIIFSLLSAIMLNGKFKGRMLARGIFFIPVIMAAGATTMKAPEITTMVVDVAKSDSLVGVGALAGFLTSMNFSSEIVTPLIEAVSSIFTTITLSGVQILIFLAGLQSISSALYEVAKIEGATGYETFWKVTFPMVSPMILTCTIYSLADAFMRSTITGKAYEVAFKQANYGLSATMSCIFLFASLCVMGIIGFLISRKVFYYD